MLSTKQPFKYHCKNRENTKWSTVIFWCTYTFLKAGVIFANFRQLGDLPFSNGLLKEKQIAWAKKFLFICLNKFNWNVTLLNGLRDIQHFYFCKNVFFRNKIERKVCSNFMSDTIARILGWFLHLAITLRVGSSMFSEKNHIFQNLGRWDLLQHLQRNYAVLLQLLHNLLIKSCFLLRWNLFFQENCIFLTEEGFDGFSETFIISNDFLV